MSSEKKSFCSIVLKVQVKICSVSFLTMVAWLNVLDNEICKVSIWYPIYSTNSQVSSDSNMNKVFIERTNHQNISNREIGSNTSFTSSITS